MYTNLELYKVFYYVAKNQNITQAANELMVSQPAISKSIKVLEDELNTKLFNRKNNGVSLTNAGEIIYNKIKKSIELIISAEEDLKSLNNMEKGTINIGAGNTIIQKYLIFYIEEFHKKYPNIDIKIHTLATPELIKRAQIGLIDIIFTHFPNNTIPSNFNEYKIKELHDIFVVNKDSKYLNKTITKKDISSLPLILLPKGVSNRQSFDEFCLKNSININPIMEIGNDIIIEEFSKTGLGVGLVNREYISDSLNKTLFELKTNFNFSNKYLGYIIDSNRENNIIIQKFIELLK